MKAEISADNSLNMIGLQNNFPTEVNRSKAQCVVINSDEGPKYFIIGGKSTNDQKLQSILEFDPVSFQIA